MKHCMLVKNTDPNEEYRSKTVNLGSKSIHTDAKNKISNSFLGYQMNNRLGLLAETQKNYKY